MMIHCDVNDGDDDDGVEDNSRKCGKVETNKQTDNLLMMVVIDIW